MNGLGDLCETYREYTLCPTNERMTFWRSKCHRSRSQQVVDVEKVSTLTLDPYSGFKTGELKKVNLFTTLESVRE